MAETRGGIKRVIAEAPTRRKPPKKKAGQAKGPRRLAGELLDVRGAAEFLGVSENLVRARVERRLLPFCRFGGRVAFRRGELAAWLDALDGCEVDEALANLRLRTQQPIKAETRG